MSQRIRGSYNDVLYTSMYTLLTLLYCTNTAAYAHSGPVLRETRRLHGRSGYLQYSEHPINIQLRGYVMKMFLFFRLRMHVAMCRIHSKLPEGSTKRLLFSIYASLLLWNQLPVSLHQPHTSPSLIQLFPPLSLFLSVNSPLSSSVTPSLFRFRLKTHLFHKSFTPRQLSSCLNTASTDYHRDNFFCANRFFWGGAFVFLFPYFCFWFHAVD